MEGRMWPIQGLSKAKRLKWGAPQNHVNWAFMKQLRERDRYVRVYDVCPYIEVYPFRENVYGLFNQNCDGAGDVWMYVVIGPEKAMVIDTGFGIGNVKGLVDELTGGMPLVVVNTHSGPDHCMGNVRFERVYCHKYCVPNITRKCAPGAWDYLFDQDGNNIWLQFDKQDVPQYRDYELIPVENHHMFNLGGDHNVELVWQPGHDSGHAMFLDHKTRILFAGDDVCSDVIACGSGGREGDPYRKYCTIEAYRNELEKLCRRLDEFDYIFPGHFIVNLENSLLLDILEALDAIVEDPQCFDFTQMSPSPTGGPARQSWHKFVKGFGTISYDPGKGVYIPEGPAHD